MAYTKEQRAEKAAQQQRDEGIKQATLPPAQQIPPVERKPEGLDAEPAPVVQHPEYGHPVPPVNHLPDNGPPQDPAMGRRTPAWVEWAKNQEP